MIMPWAQLTYFYKYKKCTLHAHIYYIYMLLYVFVGTQLNVFLFAINLNY